MRCLPRPTGEHTVVATLNTPTGRSSQREQLGTAPGPNRSRRPAEGIRPFDGFGKIFYVCHVSGIVNAIIALQHDLRGTDRDARAVARQTDARHRSRIARTPADRALR